MPILLGSSNACAKAPPSVNDMASKAMKNAALPANDRCGESIGSHATSLTRARRASGFPAAAAVGPRDDFQQVAARVLEIDTAPTVVTVDLPRLGLRRIGPVSEALIFHAGEDLIELRFADQESVVLGPDLAVLVHEIDVDPVCRRHDLKWSPFLGGR